MFWCAVECTLVVVAVTVCTAVEMSGTYSSVSCDVSLSLARELDTKEVVAPDATGGNWASTWSSRKKTGELSRVLILTQMHSLTGDT